MSILDKHLAFVNEQVQFHANRADQFASYPIRQGKHLATLSKLRALGEDLVIASRELDQCSEPPKTHKTRQVRLALTAEEVEGLPKELLQELSLSAADRTEFAILQLMEEMGGVLTLDKILIGLYRKTGEIHRRPTLVSRLYRMAQKQALYMVPGKKGVYSLDPLSDQEAAALFGGDLTDSPESVSGEPDPRSEAERAGTARST
jgi:hypothetical protein